VSTDERLELSTISDGLRQIWRGTSLLGSWSSTWKKEKTLVFKDGQEPIASGVYSALSYLRRCVALGLLLCGEGKIAFLENHWRPGQIRTTFRRLIRETVDGWDD